MRNLENHTHRYADVRTRGWVATVVAAALAAAACPPLHAAEPAEKHYSSPQEATRALVAAVRSGDTAAMIAVLGPEADDVVDSGDAVADRAARERFVARYDEANEIVNDGDAKAILQVGTDQWPFPIPLVKEEAGWRFDTAAGEDEILDRRIGRNEMSTIQVCRAIVDAQREYWARNPDGASLLHFAKQFQSDEGKRNGLYWKTREDEEPSPLGPLVAEARAEGYAHGDPNGERRPYHGYYYKMLTRQGADAPGGAYDYVAQGEMIGGFAVVARPADYGSSGVMTFLVNQDGIVYQKDLGLETQSVADAMEAFNPDATWTRVTDDGQAEP